jgi:hypothetical protein
VVVAVLGGGWWRQGGSGGARVAVGAEAGLFFFLFCKNLFAES